MSDETPHCEYACTTTSDARFPGVCGSTDIAIGVSPPRCHGHARMEGLLPVRLVDDYDNDDGHEACDCGAPRGARCRNG